MNSDLLEIVEKTKLLGVILKSDLTWDENTSFLIRNAYKRMPLLTKLYAYNCPIPDLITIYVTFIRSVLEHACVVWHSAIANEQTTDIERVQKTSLKIILKDKYQNYNHALNILELETLSERREQLCLEFARKSSQNCDTKSMFPLKVKSKSKLNNEAYKVNFASTERLKKSAIPYMQRLLNKNSQSKEKDKT